MKTIPPTTPAMTAVIKSVEPLDIVTEDDELFAAVVSHNVQFVTVVVTTG